MKKSLILILLSILFVKFSDCKSENKASFIQKVSTLFIKQQNLGQEKLYLHTDKPYYSVGEKIWFKGYLVNATSLKPNTLSQYIYVELIDKSNKIISRVKIAKDSLGFSGYLKVGNELSSGNYAVRAYTSWMQNFDKDFFFSKNIYISNTVNDLIKSSISYITNANKVIAEIRFSDDKNIPLVNKEINCTLNWNNPKNESKKIKTDNNGKISLEIDPIDNDTLSNAIRVAINEEKIRYINNFYLPEFDKDFDIQFFPESGSLLSNQNQIVSFKAIGKNGLSVNVSGKIYNNKDEEITEFKSMHKGMGKINLIVDADAEYYALVKSDTGFEKKVLLPKPSSTGIALQVKYNRGKVWYELLNNSSVPNEALMLMIHCRGKLLSVKSLGISSGNVPEVLLPTGIITFSVIDTLDHVYAERLYFAINSTNTTISMKTDRPVYGKRQEINVSFNVSRLESPTEGNFSVSIADGKTVLYDNEADNIYSNLFLTSDLKGYIESPNSYFTDSIKQNHENLDLLMLTQGWRRYNTSDILQNKFSENKYFMEVGQYISGRVKNVLGKPEKKINVFVSSQSLKLMKSTVTNDKGEYVIEGINFPDSTTFEIEAKKKNQYPDCIVIPDEEKLISSKLVIPYLQPKEINIPKEFDEQSQQNNKLNNLGNSINLDEVTVSAKNKNVYKQRESYSGMEDILVNSEKLTDYVGMPIMNYIEMIPGIQVYGDEIRVRSSLGNPLLLVNGIERNLDDFRMFTIDQIENIMVFSSGKAMLFGSRGGNGAIALELKKGQIAAEKQKSSLVKVTPLGYQKPVEFYSPKYDANNIKNFRPDLRTTLYWNPKIESDKNGSFNIKFFSADKANDYTVTVEGITKDGIPCKYQGTIKRIGQ